MRVVDRFNRLKELEKRLEQQLLAEIAKLVINGDIEKAQYLVDENWKMLKKYYKKGVRNAENFKES